MGEKSNEMKKQTNKRENKRKKTRAFQKHWTDLFLLAGKTVGSLSKPRMQFCASEVGWVIVSAEGSAWAATEKDTFKIETDPAKNP